MYLASYTTVAVLICFATHSLHVTAKIFNSQDYVPRFNASETIYPYDEEEAKKFYPFNETIWPEKVTNATTTQTLDKRENGDKAELGFLADPVRFPDDEGYRIRIGRNGDKLVKSQTYNWVGEVTLEDKTLGDGAFGIVKQGRYRHYDNIFHGTIQDPPDGCNTPHDVAVKISKDEMAAKGGRIVNILQNYYFHNSKEWNPDIVEIFLYAYIQNEVGKKALAAYEVLHKTAEYMLMNKMQINALEILQAMLGAAISAKKVNIYNMDMKLPNVMDKLTTSRGSAANVKKVKWVVIDWDIYVESSSPSYKLMGTPGYYAPEMAMYSLDDDVLRRYEITELPSWQPEKAVMYTIAMSYLYLVAGQYEGTVSAEMRDLADKIMPQMRESSDNDPHWYWFYLLWNDLRNRLSMTQFGVNNEKMVWNDPIWRKLKPEERVFFMNTLCMQEQRWGYQQALDHMFKEHSG